MTSKVTLPIVGLGAAAVKTASEFEAGMSKVQAISGASSSDMEALTAKAQEMGIKTKFSASESAEAFQYMAMAGWKTDDMLNGIEGTMYLAGASGEDLATVSDIVTDSLTAFGLKAKDSSHFADVLAAAASNSNTNVAMMGETFKYAAPVAGALGYSVEDTTTAIGLMANAGIKSSQAGTALRSWMTRMAKPTKESQKAMQDLGISLTDSSGKMKPFGTVIGDLRGGFKNLSKEQQTQYAAMLAGKEGMSGLLAITNATESDYNKLTGAIGDCNGMAKDQYNIMQDNLKGAFDTMKSAVEGVAISVGEALTPTIKKAANFIQKLAERFNGLSPETQRTIIKIAGFAAAIGPAMMVIGKLNKSVGGMISKFGKFGEAAKKGGSLIKLALKIFVGPAGVAILAIGGIIAIGVLLYKNWDKIKQMAEKLKTTIANVFKACGLDVGKFKSIFQNAGTIVKQIATLIGMAIKGILKVLKPVITFVAGVFVKRFKTAFRLVAGVATGLLTSISETIGGIKTFLGGVIDFITGVFTGNWKKAWKGVKDIFKGAFEALSGIAKAPLNAVIGLVNGAIEGLNEISFDVPEWSLIAPGKHFGVNIPTIPYLYGGTDNWPGGRAIINEPKYGGEIVDLPKGTRVYPNDESIRMARAEGKKINITINKLTDHLVVREESDIDKVATAVAKKFVDLGMNMA
ncbi:phage tail tape measure protein [Anaerovorax odorimutans]|nr:phage tail tape measure protein [Anaerovorax odorimutans]